MMDDKQTGQISEVIAVSVNVPYQQRSSFTKALNELYRLQHKVKGTFLSDNCFETDRFVYYLAYDGVDSKVNKERHSETDYRAWVLWYCKQKLLQVFEIKEFKSFRFISLLDKYIPWKQIQYCRKCGHYQNTLPVTSN